MDWVVLIYAWTIRRAVRIRALEKHVIRSRKVRRLLRMMTL